MLFSFAPKNVASWDDAQIVTQSLVTGERRVLINGGKDVFVENWIEELKRRVPVK